MNSIRKILSEAPRALIILGAATLAVFAIGLTLSISVLVATSLEKELFFKTICLTNDCVEEYVETNSQFFSMLKATFDVGVAMATIGGIFVALMSYFNTASNAALTNHIEHLKVFREYIEAEIQKRENLSTDRFDILLLYSTIFNQSRSGKTSVSDEYKEIILSLNRIIESSNEKSTKGGRFNYNEHQRNVRDHLAGAGIKISTAPRNTYFETEGQIFSLLHRIGESFCQSNSLPRIKDRKYC